ncbi:MULTISPECIES: YfcC family protein [Jeotgalicoccus]|uniref:YfcC family protein n=1 Tax=Jeotgalicoccus TaxID=227979 RepID=UPI000428022A|nr:MULTISPECIES: Na+/H+ antiporter NhaC family protein [Jeotgalicoccus]
MNKDLKKKKWEFPDTYVIVFAVLLLAVAATYIVPAGTFDRIENDGITTIVSGTYENVESAPAGFMDIFMSVQTGMVESAGLIFLVLFAGGMFEIINKSGAIHTGIYSAIDRMRGKEFLLIATIIILFALGGAVGALANSVIPFVAIGVLLVKALKLDAIVAVAITFNAAFIGFSAGFLNPYTVGVAHNISELPLFSGMTFRLIAFVLLVGVTIWYTWRYCRKILNDPSRSLIGIEAGGEDKLNFDETFTSRHKIILLWTAAALIFFVFAVVKFQWTTDHMAAFFVIIGLVAGLIAGMNYNTIAITFLEGCKNLVYGALIIGLARAVLVIMENGQILDTLVNALSQPLSALPPVATAIGMFVMNSVFNFFVPSGSGQAAIMMPIQTPLADMIGITRQVSVLAFQFGDGFSNVLFPTSGPLMASLAVAGVSWIKWAKWFFPLFLIWTGIAFVLLTVAVLINLGPF